MARKPNRVTESEVSLAVLQIAATQPSGIATFPRMKREVPNYLQLSAADRAQSETRGNEEVWEQLIRNIKSHHQTPGNILHDGHAIHVPRAGYRITDSGRRLLRRRGL